jgi:hypothetical protein
LKTHNLRVTIASASLIVVALLLIAGTTFLKVRLGRFFSSPVVCETSQNRVLVGGLREDRR